MPLGSCCFLGFVPPLVIAAKARTRGSVLWAVVSVAAFLLGFALVGSQPESVDNLATRVGAVLIVLTGVGGATYGVVVGSRLDWSRRPPLSPPMVVAPPPPDRNAGAIAGVLEVRHRRDEARNLARRDPQMARDLRIGRPDLPRRYDDGGLIDVNSAPAAALSHWLGLTSEQAQQVLSVRQQLGGFQRVDDLMNLAGLEPALYDRVVDRVILM